MSALLVTERSLTVEASLSAVWRVLTEPRHMRRWMEVVPDFDDDRPLKLGSGLAWRNEASVAYLTGTIVEFEPSHRWLLELADPTWPRPAASREVTYGFTLAESDGGVHIAFRLGDLAIDPEGRDWRDSYAGSQELERIAALARESQV